MKESTSIIERAIRATRLDKFILLKLLLRNIFYKFHHTAIEAAQSLNME